MYAIRFHGSKQQNYVTIAENLFTLTAAAAKRGASGDLVVHQDTGLVVASEEWLWDWEKKDPNSYAHKAVTNAKLAEAKQ